MRSLISILLGVIVAVLVALGVTYVIDNTEIPDWIDYLVWIVVIIALLLWSFPAYLGGGPRRTV